MAVYQGFWNRGLLMINFFKVLLVIVIGLVKFIFIPPFLYIYPTVSRRHSNWWIYCCSGHAGGQ